MEIKLDLQKYAQKLTKVAQEAPKPFSGRATGALRNSIKVEITGSAEGDLISIRFNNYGLFVDSGVRGTIGGNTGQGYNKTSYGYKDKRDRFGRPAPVGGSLPWGARVNIRKFGIPAKPWIQNMLNAITEEIARDIELELPPIIENQIAQLLSTIK
jgi:hypothetical protein